MRMINRKFTFLTTIFTFILVVFAITQTFAWISKVSDNRVIINFGNFSVQVTAQEKTDAGNNDLKMDRGTYKLNGIEKLTYENSVPVIQESYPDYKQSTTPYIETFTMGITILKADIAGYIRIRLLDEWVVTRRYINFDRVKIESVFRSGNEIFPFELAPGWYYDAKTNYCYYDKMIEKGQENVKIDFIIKGISYKPKSNAFFVETCDLTFGTSIQIVQANRLEDIWGITEIPKKPAPTPEPNPNPAP